MELKEKSKRVVLYSEKLNELCNSLFSYVRTKVYKEERPYWIEDSKIRIEQKEIGYKVRITVEVIPDEPQQLSK